MDSLRDLDRSLQALGSQLYLLHGKPTETLPALWKTSKATGITWEFDSEPYAQQRDDQMQSLAVDEGLHVQIEHTCTLHSLRSYAKDNQKPPATYEGFLKLFAALGQVTQPVQKPKTLPFDKDIHKKVSTELTKQSLLLSLPDTAPEHVLEKYAELGSDTAKKTKSALPWW
eukprot:TRINITY_DN64440_c1_g3_i1.p1 TRINITY_DN64440_c1_g3~~TRINITY_DN64440_c1_g3_i1.p1  ORF type:complete len:171 (-),score=8.26 TRINITY_DN64440_c1_g3_i1:231-743(-)